MTSTILRRFVVTMVLLLGAPAMVWADGTPQTDTDLLSKITAQSPDKKLETLATYYDLHLSEIEVVAKNERNTGAFFALRRAQRLGDDAKTKQAMATYKIAKQALSAARKKNLTVRKELETMTGFAFNDNLAVAPNAPDTLPPLAQGTPADLAQERTAAWAKVQNARAAWKKMRLKLLDDQDRYNRGEKIHLGDSMRDMTSAEIAKARADMAYRLIEAKIAVKAGKSIKDVLDKL